MDHNQRIHTWFLFCYLRKMSCDLVKKVSMILFFKTYMADFEQEKKSTCPWWLAGREENHINIQFLLRFGQGKSFVLPWQHAKIIVSHHQTLGTDQYDQISYQLINQPIILTPKCHFVELRIKKPIMCASACALCAS